LHHGELRFERGILKLAKGAVAGVVCERAERNAAAFDLGVKLGGARRRFQVSGDDDRADAESFLSSAACASILSTLRAARITLKPCSAKISTSAFPMPDEAPVMRANCEFRVIWQCYEGLREARSEFLANSISSRSIILRTRCT
jgi:hypothetical protein